MEYGSTIKTQTVVFKAEMQGFDNVTRTITAIVQGFEHTVARVRTGIQT